MQEKGSAMANIVTVEKLLWCIEHDRNVLLIGRHGVGKTTLVKEAFEQAHLKYRIFSASTMDPWVDFIGVPKEKVNGNGEPYLELIRPKEFQNDEVEAIFMDEYNRAHKKIRNATLELIQFHSINGRPFKNLRIVWAAINPDDDEQNQYDVEILDPAQKDRFHIHLSLPYKPSRRFFQDKYGDEVASTAITWWGALPDNIKNQVSPRRLEYALDNWQLGGHLEDVLPDETNVSKLRNALKTTPAVSTINRLFTEQHEKKRSLAEIHAEAKAFLADENNYEAIVNEIIVKPPMVAFFVPLMPDEKISHLLQKDPLVRSWFRRHFDDAPNVRAIMEQIIAADTNSTIAREFDRVLSCAKMDKIRTLNKDSSLNPNRLNHIRPWSKILSFLRLY